MHTHWQQKGTPLDSLTLTWACNRPWGTHWLVESNLFQYIGKCPSVSLKHSPWVWRVQTSCEAWALIRVLVLTQQQGQDGPQGPSTSDRHQKGGQEDPSSISTSLLCPQGYLASMRSEPKVLVDSYQTTQIKYNHSGLVIWGHITSV